MGFDTNGAKGRNKDVRKCGLLVSPDFLKRFLPSASPRHSDNHLVSSSTPQIVYSKSLTSNNSFSTSFWPHFSSHDHYYQHERHRNAQRQYRHDSLENFSYLRTYTFLCHHNHHPDHLRLVITTATIINMVVISQSAPLP